MVELVVINSVFGRKENIFSSNGLCVFWKSTELITRDVQILQRVMGLAFASVSLKTCTRIFFEGSFCRSDFTFSQLSTTLAFLRETILANTGENVDLVL